MKNGNMVGVLACLSILAIFQGACRKEEPVLVAAPTPQAKPYGWLDEPVAGKVDRKLKVRGWALDDDGAVARIEILVDGIPQPGALQRENREGVCKKYPGRKGCPDVGYVGEIDLTELASGAHTISARFTDDGAVVNEVGRRQIVLE